MAGNAVLLKPGRQSSPVASAFAEMLLDCQLDPTLLQILPEDPAVVPAAVEIGIDKVVLTGSASTGRAVLAGLATSLIPSTMELSGCDAAFVREDADLNLVVKALCYGLRLNGAATCISPRRVFVRESLAERLEHVLREEVKAIPATPLNPQVADLARSLAAKAVAAGARLIAGNLDPHDKMEPLVLADARPTMELLQTEIFAPVLALVPVKDDEAALAASKLCPFALGATVFGEIRKARALAERIHAGCVVVNDMIVPTADPRLPFGGRGQSGFGVTRGAEGLLEMTALKAIAVQRSHWLPHLEKLGPYEGSLLRNYLTAVHGGSFGARFSATMRLLRLICRQMFRKRSSQGPSSLLNNNLRSPEAGIDPGTASETGNEGSNP